MNHEQARKLLLADHTDWSIDFHDASEKMFSYSRLFNRRHINRPGRAYVIVSATLRQDEGGRWTCELLHLPGTQMMVQLRMLPFHWPHPQFGVFLERMVQYATRCSD